MPNFIVAWSSIADVVVGNSAALVAQISAADAASVGAYNVNMVVKRVSDGHIMSESNQFSKKITQTPTQFSRSWGAAGIAPGQYEAQINLWNSTVNAWIAQFQRFNVVAATSSAVTTSAGPKPLRAVSGGYLPDDGVSYQVILADEFDGTSLDRAKWFTRYKDNNGTLDHYGDELQRYDDLHTVSNGTLKITAKPNGQTWTAPTGKVYQRYSSQMIRSIPTHKYGYTEMRCKLPPGLGVWAAGWHLEAAPSTVCELTDMEYVRTDVNERKNMLHTGNVNLKTDHSVIWKDPNYNAWGAWTAPYTIADSFHVLSWLWEPGLYAAWIDGKPIVQRHCDWKNASGYEGGLASMIANLAMGSAWATTGVNGPWTTDVATDPQVYEIDYIRIWQKAGQILTGTAPV